MKKFSGLLAFVSLLGTAISWGADVAGAKDPPFLKRYAGSEIITYVTRSYDEYTLFIDNDKKQRKIEGAVTRIIYKVPVGHTALELLRNYQQEFKAKGFTVTREVMPCSSPYEMLGVEDKFFFQIPMGLAWNPYTNGSSTNAGPDNTGDKAHNEKLSAGRADTVVQALVKKYGIDAARLNAKGYGDAKPVASNASEDGRAKNRRVELRKV